MSRYICDELLEVIGNIGWCWLCDQTSLNELLTMPLSDVNGPMATVACGHVNRRQIRVKQSEEISHQILISSWSHVSKSFGAWNALPLHVTSLLTVPS
mmetsp:Transcript_43150/g.86796  ORF Transcript_43150/g.86796 Transcript_43150/m.86796 type:complete len:98 (+) Transcript_43150:307-600(+)